LATEHATLQGDIMAEIRPFKGIYYNQKKVNFGDVITQPYDRISPEEQLEFYEKSPFNIVRITLGREEHGDSERRNKYIRAREFLVNWLKSGILLEDDSECFYGYTMEYEIAGKKKVRRGISALLKLETFDSGVVLPHEKTFSGPKIDRLNLLRATRANFGHIFLLYSEPEKKLIKLLENREDKVFEDVVFKGVRHKIARIDDPKDIQTLIERLRDKQLLIADGHHRYSTAIDFRNELGAPERSPAGYRLVTLFNMEDENMDILPTHRAVRNLKQFDKATALNESSKFFDVDEFVGGETEISARLAKEARRGTSFVAYFGGKKCALIRLRDKERLIKDDLPHHLSQVVARLDVSILHNLVLDKLLGLTVEEQNKYGSIDYSSTIEAGMERVDSGAYQVCFFLNGTKITEVRDVAQAKAVMPHKSTDFYPKLLTGLINRRMAG
jgi:uncharacterized protein (DUF1015 family)